MNVLPQDKRDAIASLLTLGETHREISRIVGVDRETVGRLAKELGLPTTASSGMRRAHARRRRRPASTVCVSCAKAPPVAGDWCAECLIDDPVTFGKIEAFAESVERDIGPFNELERASALLIAAAYLLGSGSKMVLLDAVFGRHKDVTAHFDDVVWNLQRNGFLVEGGIALEETDGSLGQESLALLLAVMCGAGSIQRVA